MEPCAGALTRRGDRARQGTRLSIGGPVLEHWRGIEARPLRYSGVVAKLANARDLGSRGEIALRVQVPSTPPSHLLCTAALHWFFIHQPLAIVPVVPAFVLLARRSADVRLVHFHRAFQQVGKRSVFHGVPDAVCHEPCGAVGAEPEFPLQLQGGHALFGGAKQVKRQHPFVQRDVGAFKDGAHGHGEMK